MNRTYANYTKEAYRLKESLVFNIFACISVELKGLFLINENRFDISSRLLVFQTIRISKIVISSNLDTYIDTWIKQRPEIDTKYHRKYFIGECCAFSLFF